jgi:hypothetical protein
MDFNERQIAAPRYWQKFEDVCLSIFRNVWEDPTAQKNGRSGQRQHGTDISGTASYANGAVHGVQCKGKDVGLGATVSEKELRDEVAKARNFTPALSHWILATTAPKDAGIEQLAREITAEHQASGLFKVQVLGWEDLQSLMARFPAVIEEHYPDQAPAILLMLERLAAPVATASPGLTAAISAGVQAAKNDLEKFRQAGNLASAVVLGVEKEVGGNWHATSHSDLILALRSGQSALLEAEPGAGKSITLHQLAAASLAERTDCVAVIVPLPEVGFTQRELIDEIANRASFRDLGRDALSLVAEAGQFVVLCDGWNELPSDHRQRVGLGLAKFRRDFPGCGLLVATRALSPHPIHGASYLRLLSPTWAQQLDILREQIGAEAEGLLARAHRIPGLRDLLRTPLYVSVLAELGGSGKLPATKEEAIRHFIDNQEGRAGHRDVLREQLQNRHRQYLCAAARLLTSQGAVAISESDLRREIAAAAVHLVEDGQLSQKPNPQPVIDALVSHHVLIERVNTGSERLYSFQHQQFQEWFASFYVQDCVIAASENASLDNLKALDSILDQSDLTEPLLFAIERLSRASAEGARHASHVIVRAIRIDPLLAAEIIHRATAEVWALIAEPVTSFATEWFDSGDRVRAFRFMMMTGRPEFAEPVWEVIRNKERYDQGATFASGWFDPSVLGPDGHADYAQLPADQRRSLLWDLALHGGQDGIDFVVKACRSEVSAEVVQWALEILEGDGTDAEFSSVWQTASAEVWARLALNHGLSHTSGDFRSRLVEEKKKLAAASPDTEKLRLLLELAEVKEFDDPEEVVSLALAVKQQDYQAENTTFSRLSSLYPEHLSRAIIERLVLGESFPPSAGRLVGVGSPEQQQSLREIALGISTRDGRGKEIAGRALNIESAQSLIGELFTVLDQLHNGDETNAKPLRQRYQAITDALNVLHHEIFVPSLLGAHAEEPRHISALAELLFRWRSDDRDDALPIDDVSAERLSRAIAEWVERIVSHPEAKRYELSYVATAIKRVARPSLLPCLKRLFEAELLAWHRDRAEREQQQKGGRRIMGANMSYAPIYRQAFEAFEGKEVRDLLLGYIGNPYFEAEAAIALRRYGTDGRIPSPAETIGWPKYGEVSAARLRRRNLRVPTSVAAKVVLDRIDALIATGRADNLQLAIGLATAATQMDYGSRIGTINAVVTAPGPMSGRHGLLQVLLFTGEAISAASVRQGLDEALAKVVGQQWRSQNEWWVIGRWFELLAFTDAPELMIDAAEALPSDLKQAHNFDRVVTALGHADPGAAFKTLLGLAEKIQGLEATHSYPGALVHIGSLEAAKHLMSLSFDPQSTHISGHGWFSFANALTAMLIKHPSVKREFLARVTEKRDSLAPIHARVLSEIIDQKDVISLLQHCDPSGNDPISQALEHAVGELTMARHSIEGTNASEREPADLSWLRSELFRVYLKHEPIAGFAAKLLSIIDIQRDMYGRPPSEPRHPDVGSGAPWPAIGGRP